MNKADLVRVVAENAGISLKAARKAVDTVFETIREATLRNGESVSIRGFGKFYAVKLPERTVYAWTPYGYNLVDAGPMLSIRLKPYKKSRLRL